jgi:hypothetical protein
LKTNISTVKKLAYKWLGLYRIQIAVLEKETYILEEFDRIKLPKTYAEN